MTSPRISVQVMVHNSARYLEHCIESLRRQTFADFEVLLLDAGSRDRSAQICADIQRQDARFLHLRYEDSLPIGPAREAAFERSRGDYIAVLDSDDWAHPQRLERQAAWLDVHPETILLGSYYRVVNAQGIPIRVWPIHFKEDVEIRWRVTFGNCLTHSTVMFRRAAAQAIGGYNATLPTGEDIDFYGRMLPQGKFHVLNEPLVHYRTHPESLSNTEPPDRKETFANLVQRAIQREVGEAVDRPLAAALYNQSMLPAAGSSVALASLRLLKKAHSHFQLQVAKTKRDQKLLGRTVFLHLLQFMTKNQATAWWPAVEPEWRSLVRLVALRGIDYDWRFDPGLIFYMKDFAKTALRALFLSLI